MYLQSLVYDYSWENVAWICIPSGVDPEGGEGGLSPDQIFRVKDIKFLNPIS